MYLRFQTPTTLFFWGDYRVTIITDELFRIERSENKKFRDNPTQTVWFRDFGAVKYSVKNTDDGIIITTKKVSVAIKRNREDCYVEINGKAVATDNSQNLKGTYSTLDCCDGKKLIKFPWMTVQYKEITDEIQLENGVCSRNGVAVLDDSSLSFDENGKISDRKADGSDEYIFAYGNSYKRAVSDFYVKSVGEKSVIPEKRIMRINFVNINDGQIEYTVDGKRREAEELYIDGTGLQIVFEPHKKSK